ncbi:MAG: 30S ribosomal protein S1 [Deltaproteobacteria bacterium]|nr:MAG: 30S ribosomal protein S1 [Deltaproteobacteria bacterium]
MATDEEPVADSDATNVSTDAEPVVDSASAEAPTPPAADKPAEGATPAPSVVEEPAESSESAEPPAADEPAESSESAEPPAADEPAESSEATKASSSDGQAAAEGTSDSEASTGESDGSTGDRKKRRRRRRRGKKPANGEQAESSDDGPTSEARRPRKYNKPERPAFNIGDDVFGRVSKLTAQAVLIDVAGGKAEGIFDREQLIQIPPKEGEQMIAKVKSVSTRGGMLMLGPDPWDATQSRAELRAALEMNTQLDFWVTGVIKGGLEVDYKGVRAFAPASHVELRPGSDLSHWLGEKLGFVVTRYGKKGRDVVVSRKETLQAEHKVKRAEELTKLEPGMKCKAIVRTVLQWGAFVALPDFADVEGVIHMTEASHNRSARLNDLFRPGGKIEVEVLRIDEKGKLWLSHKATTADPWDEAAKKYATGTRLTGKVVRLTDFGAFVQLEPGIDGLCHVADLSFSPVDHPKEVVSEGTDLDVVVAYLDIKARKVTLHPAPPDDEKDHPTIRKVQLYKIVDVVVMQIRDGGLGVRIVGATGRNARAFIPSGQTGTPRGTDLRKSFPLGKRLQAKVIDADSRRGEPRLSIRAVKQDAEKQAYRDYRKKVQRESSFGTFADLLKDKL